MRGGRTLLVALVCAWGCSACDLIFPDHPEERFARIEADVQVRDYDAAMAELQAARKDADGASQRYLDYNRSILDILAGKCDRARLELDALLKLNTALDSEQRSEIISESTRFRASLHYAYGTALLCPVALSEWAEEADFEKALSHFYIAESLGLDISGEISKVISEWFPPCRSYIPNEQIQASAPGHALQIKPDDSFADIVVCKEGVWFKANVRAYEILLAKLKLKPLDRKIWMDESSELPFVQLHVDCYEAPGADMSFGPPIAHYEYPIPEGEIPEADRQNLEIDLPELLIKNTGMHYVHFYTVHNGEARLFADFSRQVDCGKIDDTVTYSDDLAQIPVRLESGMNYEKLMLCAGRPDRFEVVLEGGQQGLFEIEVPAAERHVLKDTTLKVYGDDDMTLTENGAFCGDSVCYRVLRHKHDPELKDDYGASDYVVLKNITDDRRTYYLEIALKPEASSHEYNLVFKSSGICPDKPDVLDEDLQLEGIEGSRYHTWQPSWLCPHQVRRYHPKIGPNAELLRAVVKMDYIGFDEVDERLVHFESFMTGEQDSREYSVETGGILTSHWMPELYAVTRVLQKPVTRSIHFRSENETRDGVFEILEIKLSEDENSEDNKDSEDKQDKQDKQDENKDQKDQPNQAPEKPSETAATPRGEGSDAEGDESTPDEHAQGNKASQYDARQHEKDHIDALMDDMERGLYYVPLPGQLPERSSGKDW